MMTKKMLIVLLTFTTSFLFGCVGTISERHGADIQVVPITYSYLITIKEGNESVAWNELEEYIDQNWKKFSTQSFEFTWYSGAGNKLANEFHSELLSRGINRRQLSITKALVPEDSVMDLKFEVTVHRVVTEVCEYSKVGSYGSTKESCYTEGVRWKSMVNPDKMLTTSSQ